MENKSGAPTSSGRIIRLWYKNGQVRLISKNVKIRSLSAHFFAIMIKHTKER